MQDAYITLYNQFYKNDGLQNGSISSNNNHVYLIIYFGNQLFFNGTKTSWTTEKFYQRFQTIAKSQSEWRSGPSRTKKTLYCFYLYQMFIRIQLRFEKSKTTKILYQNFNFTTMLPSKLFITGWILISFQNMYVLEISPIPLFPGIFLIYISVLVRLLQRISIKIRKNLSCCHW